LTNEPLPMFDFATNKWYHQPCWAKMQQRKRTVMEQKAITERQKLIAEWNTF
jgi:hypothetical protein